MPVSLSLRSLLVFLLFTLVIGDQRGKERKHHLKGRHLQETTPTAVDKPKSPLVVVSLTTSPKRLLKMEVVINDLLQQTRPPDYIQINLPYVFRRNNETYPNISTIHYLKNDKIIIHRCEDIGPITKLYPTLKTFPQNDTLIITVDDDTVYPRHLVQTFYDLALKAPHVILAGHCGDVLLSNPEEQFVPYPPNLPAGTGCCCRLFEGYGAIGYRRGLFYEDTALIPGSGWKKDIVPITFDDYLHLALSDQYCFKADDFTISNYLSIKGIQGIDISRSFGRIRQHNFGFEEDALHHQQDGTPRRYIDCTHFLMQHKIGIIAMKGA